tara:strand:+ start:195 stop:1034 length:840 start_codon:yes stop_codon:yes gene_type:complete
MTSQLSALIFGTSIFAGWAVLAQNEFELDFPENPFCNKAYIMEIDRENAQVFEVNPDAPLIKQLSEQYGCDIEAGKPFPLQTPNQIFLSDSRIYDSTVDEGNISYLGSVDRILIGENGTDMILSGSISDQNAMASARFIVPAEELAVRDYGWVTSKRPMEMTSIEQNSMDFFTDFGKTMDLSGIMARSQEDWLALAALLPDSRVLVSISSEPKPASIIIDGLSNDYETEIELAMTRKQMQTLNVSLDGYQVCKPGDSDFISVPETYGKKFAVRCVMEPN